MNGVAPSRRLTVRKRSPRPAAKKCGRTLPRREATGGRGRSAGSASKGAAPSRCRRQKASWISRFSPCSHSRCQAAKSAYWIGSSGSGAGRPARRAPWRMESSRIRMAVDQASATL